MQPFAMLPPMFGFGVKITVSDIMSSHTVSTLGGVSEETATDALKGLDQNKIGKVFWGDVMNDGREALMARKEDPASLEEAQAELESQLSALLQPQTTMRM